MVLTKVLVCVVSMQTLLHHHLITKRKISCHIFLLRMLVCFHKYFIDFKSTENKIIIHQFSY